MCSDTLVGTSTWFYFVQVPVWMPTRQISASGKLQRAAKFLWSIVTLVMIPYPEITRRGKPKGKGIWSPWKETLVGKRKCWKELSWAWASWNWQGKTSLWTSMVEKTQEFLHRRSMSEGQVHGLFCPSFDVCVEVAIIYISQCIRNFWLVHAWSYF